MGTKMTELVDVPALEERETQKINVFSQASPGGSAAHQCDVEEKDVESVQSTPMEKMTLTLYIAAASGNVAALEEMPNQKTNVFVQVCHGRNTALHISAYHGRRAFVERLLQLISEKSDEEATNEDRGRSLLIAGNKEGNTALHEAVRGVGDAEIVKALIKADEALAGISNKKRQTCLHYALFYQKYDLAYKIIEKCPQLCDQKYLPENNLLDITALRECPVSIVEKLLKSYGGGEKRKTVLHVAAAQGHVAVVKSILRSETNCMEITDEVGRTALHYAVEHAKIRVVIVLVKAMGMLINIADNEGCTALDIANQKYEEEPLSRYFAIQFFLRRMNAVAGMKAANKTREEPSKANTCERYFKRLNILSVAGMKDANKTREEPSKANTCERYSKRLNILSVCAIFIATVTFQAAFTVPHRFQDNEHPDPLTMTMWSAPVSTVVYRALGASGSFLIFDALAFGLSIVTIINLAYVHIFCRYRNHLLVVVAILLTLALNMMIDAFCFAILIQLNPERHMVASIINYVMVLVVLLLFVVLPITVLNAFGIFGLLTFLT